MVKYAYPSAPDPTTVTTPPEPIRVTVHWRISGSFAEDVEAWAVAWATLPSGRKVARVEFVSDRALGGWVWADDIARV
jgi:hypothetical protein